MKFVISALLFILPATSFAETFAGVGMVLRGEEGKTFVEQLLPDAPAQRDGRIQAGDEIVSVKTIVREGATWTPVEGLGLEEVVGMIRGEEGTKVGLHFTGSGGQYEVELTRETIQIPE
jgi:carboxyl-terminal processing protease